MTVQELIDKLQAVEDKQNTHVIIYTETFTGPKLVEISEFKFDISYTDKDKNFIQDIAFDDCCLINTLELI